jgi:hypothetical protein
MGLTAPVFVLANGMTVTGALVTGSIKRLLTITVFVPLDGLTTMTPPDTTTVVVKLRLM